jgi:hypothetical protein
MSFPSWGKSLSEPLFLPRIAAHVIASVLPFLPETALAIDEQLIAAEVARIGRIESLVGSRSDGPVQFRDQKGVAVIDAENGGPTVTSKAMLIVSSDEVLQSDDFTSVPLAS